MNNSHRINLICFHHRSRLINILILIIAVAAGSLAVWATSTTGSRDDPDAVSSLASIPASSAPITGAQPMLRMNSAPTRYPHTAYSPAVPSMTIIPTELTTFTISPSSWAATTLSPTSVQEYESSRPSAAIFSPSIIPSEIDTTTNSLDVTHGASITSSFITLDTPIPPSSSPSLVPSTFRATKLPSMTIIPKDLKIFTLSPSSMAVTTLSPTSVQEYEQSRLSVVSSLPSRKDVEEVSSNTPPTRATLSPSSTPSAIVSGSPSDVVKNTLAPLSTLTTFCVIADVPYTDRDFVNLKNQLLYNTPEDCEFLIHLGDIKNSSSRCDDARFQRVEQVLTSSPIPLFMILGDNEWNDCPHNAANYGWDLWVRYFLGFENKHWTHDINVNRHASASEQFSFVRKRTLFIGLNLVGGKVLNKGDWDLRIANNLEWTKELVTRHVPMEASGVIVFGHAKPGLAQQGFLNPLAEFIQLLDTDIPFLYLHGDGHEWIYTPDFFNVTNYLRIQHRGGTSEPILRMYADPYGYPTNVVQAFTFDRRLNNTLSTS